MRLLAAALLMAALAGLAGCSGDPGRGPAAVTTPSSHVDVDSADLHSQKKDVGVEPCRPGKRASDHEDALPRIVLPCLGGGRSVDLNELRGPLVINLFAQWCEPCRDELPYYQRLHEEAPGGVRVLGIDYEDTQPSGALDLADQAGVTFPLLADPSSSLRPVYRIRGLPGVILVDEDGRVRLVRFTVMDSYEQLATLVRENLLAGQASAK